MFAVVIVRSIILRQCPVSTSIVKLMFAEKGACNSISKIKPTNLQMSQLLAMTVDIRGSATSFSQLEMLRVARCQLLLLDQSVRYSLGGATENVLIK